MKRRTRRNPETAPFFLEVRGNGRGKSSSSRYRVLRAGPASQRFGVAELAVDPDYDYQARRRRSPNAKFAFLFHGNNHDLVGLNAIRTPRGDLTFTSSFGMGINRDASSGPGNNTDAAVDRFGAQIDELLELHDRRLAAGEYDLQSWPADHGDVRGNPGTATPRGMREIYHASNLRYAPSHVLSWVDSDARGYQVSLAPHGRVMHVSFLRGWFDIGQEERTGDFLLHAPLRQGRVVFSEDALRRMGASGRLVFAQMWPRLLAHMARR